MSGRIALFVCSFCACGLQHDTHPLIMFTTGYRQDGADNLLCLFVLSAIEPDLMASVLRKSVKVPSPRHIRFRI